MRVRRSGGAGNRLYYAAFYAARALLALHQVDAARHSGLINLFHQYFIKTGLVVTETGKTLSRAFEKRQSSDYGDFTTVDPTDARDHASAVHVFVDHCEQLLNRLLRES